MNNFVEAEWLNAELVKENIRIVDCRFNLASPEEGHEKYKENHIPGAVYFHLEKDLSAPVGKRGGRHPLPSAENFVKVLEAAGIGNDTTVVAYDCGEGAYAARLWWMLKYIGHEHVFILNGGYPAWTKAGYPVNNEVSVYVPGVYQPSIQENVFASYEEVKAVVSGSAAAVLVDSREKRRYTGEFEPIDKKAGHIPGAINKPWLEGFENGKFKAGASQQSRFIDLAKDSKIIVYCGSGVTAAPNYLALKAAGFEKVKLYAGSFSDWISYEENEVATEK